MIYLLIKRKKLFNNQKRGEILSFLKNLKMSKIPTAEEFMESHNMSSSDNRKKILIEFAALHVEAALKSALEDAPTGSSTDIPSYEEMRDSILNAYPLTNIK